MKYNYYLYPYHHAFQMTLINSNKTLFCCIYQELDDEFIPMGLSDNNNQPPADAVPGSTPANSNAISTSSSSEPASSPAVSMTSSSDPHPDRTKDSQDVVTTDDSSDQGVIPMAAIKVPPLCLDGLSQSGAANSIRMMQINGPEEEMEMLNERIRQLETENTQVSLMETKNLGKYLPMDQWGGVMDAGIGQYCLVGTGEFDGDQDSGTKSLKSPLSPMDQC